MRPLAEVCLELGEAAGLVVRPWTSADAEQLASAWGDAEIARWNPVPPDPSVEFARSWIEGAASQTTASRGVDVVAVRSVSPEIVLGELGLQVDHARRIAEVGFWVATEARTNGVAKTLLQFAVRLGEVLELQTLAGLVDPSNAAALRTFESVGWVELPTRSSRRAFGIQLA